MIVTRGAQRAIIAAYFSLLAVLYLLAWSQPGLGLAQEDAIHLVTAKALVAGHGYVVDSLPLAVAETQYPPLFPALLALFTLVSQQALWLKLLPLICAVGWLWVTRNLLLMMGASRNAALLLIALAAASPVVLFVSTSLLPQALFGLLVAGALLALLKERALFAGILAGLATLTQESGVALIFACILTLIARRRFRRAAIFALTAMVIAAPWFGWSLAHITHDARLPGLSRAPFTIFTGLAASEKLVVISHNLFALVASPIALLTGYVNTFTVSVTILLTIGCLIFRRQTVPDLFMFFYGVALLCFITPPERSVAPVLPLVLWMVWRVVRLMKSREALVAIVIFAMMIPIGINVQRLMAGRSPDKWSELQKAFAYIRANTPADTVVLANMDALTFLNTGRKAVRGFDANGFDLYYSPRQSPVSPDQLSRSIVVSRVGYVLLTPDEGLPESAAFHRSVEALARGGVVEPVTVPGIAQGYALFRVAAQR
jgi:hypothetical protein